MAAFATRGRTGQLRRREGKGGGGPFCARNQSARGAFSGGPERRSDGTAARPQSPFASGAFALEEPRPPRCAPGSRPPSPRAGDSMAGLELLYRSVAADISCPQDALLCYLHWKLLSHHYRCLGAGEQVGRGGAGRGGCKGPPSG